MVLPAALDLVGRRRLRIALVTTPPAADKAALDLLGLRHLRGGGLLVLLRLLRQLVLELVLDLVGVLGDPVRVDVDDDLAVPVLRRPGADAEPVKVIADRADRDHRRGQESERVAHGLPPGIRERDGSSTPPPLYPAQAVRIQ